jgi:hypothetical protein
LESDSDKHFHYLVQVVDYLCIEDFVKSFIEKMWDGKSFTTILEDVLVKRLGSKRLLLSLVVFGAGEVVKFT